MINDYRAKRILKKYGKALYKSRTEYVDASLGITEVPVHHHNLRFMAKKSLIAAVILILTFALFIISASALGIKLFDSTFFSRKDHDVVVGNMEYEKSQDESVRFCEIGYIPDGYSMIQDDTSNITLRNTTFINDKEEYLYIDQSVASSFRMNINNENCTISKETIREMEVVIYDYGELKCYMMQYENIIINILGRLTDAEFNDIIYGFSFENISVKE